jgi:hypothetical protein
MQLGRVRRGNPTTGALLWPRLQFVGFLPTHTQKEGDDRLKPGLWRKVCSWVVSAALLAAPAATHVAYAAAVPELLITEIVPASAGTSQPYEFVEIHNPTNQPIDLQGYSLRYITAAPYTTGGNTWTITDKVIPARGTLVLWLKKFVLPVQPLDDFNANYDTHLTEDQVFLVKLTTEAQGLHDSSKRRVAIARPDKSLITSAYINDGVADGKTNKSITYKYVDGIEMQKLANGQDATPGEVLPGQVPAADGDTTPPAAPTGLTAEAGAGEVSLTWAPSPEEDLGRYHVYVNGVRRLTLDPSQTTVAVAQLTGLAAYDFTVTAEDKSGNESAPSEAAAATPTHVVITQQERLDYEVDAKYPIFPLLSEPGAVVPGLVEGLVPQGAAWWPDQNWLVFSNYLQDGRPSTLTAVDAATGELVKTVWLYWEDGTPYTGHAGGVSITGRNAWLANASQLFRVDLAELLAAEDGSNLHFAGRFPVITNASFSAVGDDIIWVGEFYHPPTYNTNPTHELTNRAGNQYNAWVAGYRINPETDEPASATPDYILSVTNKIQGMAITSDSIVLSQSYGRKNDSFLYRYTTPDFAGEPHQTVTVDGQEVPVWFLDETTQAPNQPVLTLPPLAEGIVADAADKLYVLFESGANEYRYDGFNPLDRLAVVDMDAWARYGTIAIEALPEQIEAGEAVQVRVTRYEGLAKPPADVTEQAVITVSDAAVAAVEGAVIRGVAPGAVTVTAAFAGLEATVDLKVVTVAQVVLTVPVQTLAEGERSQVQVTVVYDDGSTTDVTAKATLTATQGGEVTIGADGVITGAKPGEVRLTAEYQGVSSEVVRLTVRPAEAKGNRK